MSGVLAGSETLGMQASQARCPKWRNWKVLELGCGCGLAAVYLGYWGATVVATDTSSVALELAEENARYHLARSNRPYFVRLDWTDLDACARLRDKFGPFHAIVASDCVLASSRTGPQWGAQGISALPPGPLLDATRVFGCDGAEVIIVVADRVGEVAQTAEALIERRRNLEILSMPQDVIADGGGKVTVFHFRWHGSTSVESARMVER
eukprot:gnl/TRDRNA2_/TRDRNA2_161463_c0_seq1.p1 gnl/TRDRNA2_/TRDRNA2_161463_c0~~gnl/TRDRNA2_/TRDRNA2_161463_c0_seq1.p1  ORF type:complete len:209 (-),score=26.17 gnl/TRDRNA2_/TRDRNA2_161463_c0_seq1:32-658(-)